MKKLFNIIINIIQFCVIIYVILVVAFMFFSNRYGYSEIGKYVLDVDNNYLLVIKKNSDIKLGDYVYYYSVVGEKYRISSNNVSNIDKKIYTMNNGDIVSKSKVIGKSTRKINGVGFILNKMKDKVYFLLYVLMPIFIVFVYQVYLFITLRVDLKEKE